jgi:tripartite-type tricarboxylate transporter receptor subunit TctC
MGTTRVPYYKDIPTLIEQGIPVSFTQYRGFFGGPNFPAEAVKFWDETFPKLMKTKQYEEFMTKFDVIPQYKTAAETKALVTEYVKGLQEDLKFMDLK